MSSVVVAPHELVVGVIVFFLLGATTAPALAVLFFFVDLGLSQRR